MRGVIGCWVPLSGTVDYVCGPGGRPTEQVPGSGSAIYLSQERLGSPRLMTNSSGAVVALPNRGTLLP